MAEMPLPHWDLLSPLLPDGWRDWAKAHRILTMRKLPHNAKLTSVDQVLYLLLSYVGLGTSLRTTAASTEYSPHFPSLSSVSLHQWLRKSGPWCAQIATAMTERTHLEKPGRWRGWEVIVGDGSVVTKPGSTGTDARLHYALRLADLSYVHAEVTDPSQGEKFARFPVSPGELWLVDRNFCNPPAIAFARSRQAHLLVRYHATALPLVDESGKSFDVVAAVATLRREGDLAQWNLHTGKEASRQPVRLLVRKGSAQQRQQHLERLRKEHGSTIPAKLVALAGFILLVTTLTEQELPLVDAFPLYRLRWQVERTIKQDKTLGDIDKLPCLLPESIYGWLTAKMVLTLLTRRLAQQADEPAFPPWAVPRLDLPRCALPSRSTCTASGARELAGHACGVAGRAGGADVGAAGSTARGTGLLPGPPRAVWRARTAEANQRVSRPRGA